MKFIVDESSGAAVAEYLRSMGHNVLAVAEVLSQANDQDILARAVNEGRIVVTNDKDFGELMFRSGQAHNGVLLLRLHDESPANRVRMVSVVFEQHTDQLADHFIVASESGIRIRPARELP